MQSAVEWNFVPSFIRVVALAARFFFPFSLLPHIILACKYLNMNEAKYFNLNITQADIVNIIKQEEGEKRRRIIK